MLKLTKKTNFINAVEMRSLFYYAILHLNGEKDYYEQEDRSEKYPSSYNRILGDINLAQKFYDQIDDHINKHLK